MKRTRICNRITLQHISETESFLNDYKNEEKKNKIITISVELSTHAWKIKLIGTVCSVDKQIKTIAESRR